MRSTFILLTLLILNYCSFSQSFMGITIDGTQSAVKSKLLQKGFKLLSSSENSNFYSGKINNEDIKIMVRNTVNSKKVYSFFINFDKEIDSWNKLESEFENKNIILKNKYGEPLTEERKYEYPFDENDELHLLALESGKLTYLNLWNEVGENKLLKIALSITSGKTISMIYLNIINEKIAKNELLIQNKKDY